MVQVCSRLVAQAGDNQTALLAERVNPQQCSKEKLDVDEYQFPAVRIAVASCGDIDPPALWMLDWPDLTETYDLMTPKNHMIIRGFDGFSNAT